MRRKKHRRSVEFVPKAVRNKGHRKREHSRTYFKWMGRMNRLIGVDEAGHLAPGLIALTFKESLSLLYDRRTRNAFERRLKQHMPNTRYAVKYEMDEDGMGVHAHVSAEPTMEAWGLANTAHRKDGLVKAWEDVESLLKGVTGTYAPVPDQPQWSGYVLAEDASRWAGYMAKDTYDGGLSDTHDAGSRSYKRREPRVAYQDPAKEGDGDGITYPLKHVPTDCRTPLMRNTGYP